MSIIMGLDVSTSIIGVCVLDSNIALDDKGSHILLLDKIDLKNCKNLWDKADRSEKYLRDIRTTFITSEKFVPGLYIDRIVVEEPLLGFRPGMSSAATISTLVRFNGIVSYISRNIFNKHPEYIGSGHARKLCGIKLQRTKIGGPQKEQVFAHFSQHDLKHVVWPLKKSGKHADWSRDATDAYCIAMASRIENEGLDQFVFL